MRTGPLGVTVSLSDLTALRRQVVRLVDLLDEAKRRCLEQLQERNADMGEEEMQTAAAAMGYGAVKYADLHQNRTRYAATELHAAYGLPESVWVPCWFFASVSA